jgi:hypothetical protein
VEFTAAAMKTAATATVESAATAAVAAASSAVLGEGCLWCGKDQGEGCNACEKSFVSHFHVQLPPYKRVGPGGRKAHLQANPTLF